MGEVKFQPSLTAEINKITQKSGKQIIAIIENGQIKKYIVPPPYGEIKLTCHDGQIRYIEKNDKEKVD